jgi:hypothetical protein
MDNKAQKDGQSREERSLALAIVDSLNMWSDPRYSRFLSQDQPGALDEDWFRQFAGGWRVARTINQNKMELVRQYLDVQLRQQLANGHGARCVDEAAAFIQKKCWSAQKRKDGKASLPLSLVSKVGFFFRPHELVPYDNYARHGLNRLRRPKRMGGQGNYSGGSYHGYLEAFDDQFSRRQEQIRNALTESWVTILAAKLGCRTEALTSLAMQRKTFDNFLMQIGRTNG